MGCASDLRSMGTSGGLWCQERARRDLHRRGRLLRDALRGNKRWFDVAGRELWRRREQQGWGRERNENGRISKVPLEIHCKTQAR